VDKYFRVTLTTLFFAVLFNSARAQAPKADTINVGIVTGLLRDSLHNYVLQSATLAIYKVKDNELINYQLSNAFGKYQFKNMPVGMPLRVVVTHVGYQSTKKEFEISPKTKEIDLKTINVERLDLSLKEVVIAAQQAPMQMHGDTLEFNASAFKLDSNAVVGDLLRKLPGVTVWADGVITVNGKTINRLLVDGKDFFNGNNKVALENIPKNSVQKVQVYRNKDDKNSVTPKTDMNIVLKKDKKDGMFGKFGLGYGTQQHYASDGMITYFSPKTQVSVVGAYNDVNKTADNVGELMQFNSFKGEGINNDYHSDFTKQGVNVFKGGGATFSHDFSKDSDPRQSYYKTNMLKGEVFTSDANNKTIRESQTYISLGSAGTQTQISNQTNTSDNFSLRSSASYQKRFLHQYLGIDLNNTDSHGTSLNNQTTITSNDQTADKSQNIEQQNDRQSSTNAGGSIYLETERYFDFNKREMKGLNTEIKYSFSLDHGNDNSTNITDFKATDATQNRYFNRQYLKDWNGYTNTLSTNFKDLIPLVFKRYQFFHIDVSNEISVHTIAQNDNVGDLLAGVATYTPNTDLTNLSHFKTIDERPRLGVYKDFAKYLDNRFYKGARISVTAQDQIYQLTNSATQPIQNLSRSYNYFVPYAELSYYNEQYGDFSKNYRLSYNTSVNYPGIYQLAPLIDDANIYSKTVSNLSLKPSYKHSINFNYDYNDQAKKNPLSYNLWVAGGLVKDNIADSVSYDELSRAIHKFINTAEAKTFNFNNTVRKAFNFKDHQFQLTGNTGIDYSQYTSNINGTDYLTKATNLSGSAEVNYTYKSLWSASISERYNGSKNSQGDLSRYSNYTWTTNFGFAFAFPKSFFFNTRTNLNNTKSSAADHNIYYTIWNADLGYRFLKHSQGEIKLSALDILHQNKSIENYIGTNQLTTTSTNVLRQYFMLTLAYYPRNFGLHKKKSE
jgi:hypothetical protein